MRKVREKIKIENTQQTLKRRIQFSTHLHIAVSAQTGTHSIFLSQLRTHDPIMGTHNCAGLIMKLTYTSDAVSVSETPPPPTISGCIFFKDLKRSMS